MQVLSLARRHARPSLQTGHRSKGWLSLHANKRLHLNSNAGSSVDRSPVCCARRPAEPGEHVLHEQHAAVPVPRAGAARRAGGLRRRGRARRRFDPAHKLTVATKELFGVRHVAPRSCSGCAAPPGARAPPVGMRGCLSGMMGLSCP